MTGRPSIDERVRRYSVGIVTITVCKGKRKGFLVLGGTVERRSFTSAWTHSQDINQLKNVTVRKFFFGEMGSEKFT